MLAAQRRERELQQLKVAHEEIRNLAFYDLGDHLKTGHLWSLQNRPLWMA
jgi:hypothetical protein